MLSDLGRDRKLRTRLEPVTRRRIESINALLPLDPFVTTPAQRYQQSLIVPCARKIQFQDIGWEILNDKIIRELQSRLISHRQLVAEVTGIYAGLVMVEGKCREVDYKASVLKQVPQPGPTTQNSDSSVTPSQEAPSDSTAKKSSSDSATTRPAVLVQAKELEGYLVDDKAKQLVQEKEQPFAQEKTIIIKNDNDSTVPVTKEKPSETKEADSTPAFNEENQPPTAEAAPKPGKQVQINPETEIVVFHDAVRTQPQQANEAYYISVLQAYSPEQYQALVALHRTLLHEHHDFFLASQHPSASRKLKRLAEKYAMAARMWRYGIHGFLELLRHRLPDSLEPMLAFIYLAYSMCTLLWETVPAFRDTWAECLGDISRLRLVLSLPMLYLALRIY